MVLFFNNIARLLFIVPFQNSHMKNSLISILLVIASITGIVPAGAQQPAIPYGSNPASAHYIVLNGVRHYYEVYGSGRPLLLIHGNGTGIKGWGPQIDYFSQQYTVYAIDCRGRGNTPLGPDTLTYAQQASDMAAFISTLKLDSVSVVGKSDGGIIGILMGIYYPAHLSKIVAFGANMWPDSTALYPATVTEIREERIHADEKITAKDTTQNWVVTRQRYRMMECQPHITAAQLQKITVPVLVLSCDRDLIKEEHTLFIYKNIPRSSLCIFPGESHHIAKQNPLLFNTTIAHFLASPYRDQSFRYHQ